MAMDFREARRAVEGEDDRRPLNEEARAAREAGRSLDKYEDQQDLAAAVIRLQELVEKQSADAEQLRDEMRQMLFQMQNILDEVDQIRTDALDERNTAQQAVLKGLIRAQKQAEEITISNVQGLTERCAKYIDTLTQESLRRVERLAAITLPDRLFYYGKWLALSVGLFILVHILWQTLA